MFGYTAPARFAGAFFCTHCVVRSFRGCMTGFDGVVIDAGHNGLTLAAYLARAGMKIAVLERNPRIGGGCSTDTDRLPGFQLNLHANF